MISLGDAGASFYFQPIVDLRFFFPCVNCFNKKEGSLWWVMSTGRVCPRCLRDVVLVCQCRVSTRVVPPTAASCASLPKPRPPLNPVAQPQRGGNVVVGTSHALEKSYSRPSSAPSMSLVRPVHVLREAFHKCIQRPIADLRYISDQLKGIRQDLTVQAASADSPFKALVYEYHARVSLLLGDTPEFGQCLNNVHALHAKGHFGTSCAGALPSSSIPFINPPALPSPPRDGASAGAVPTPLSCSSLIEFAAYRIVYTGLMSKHEDDLAMELSYLEKRHQHAEHHCPPKKRSRDGDEREDPAAGAAAIVMAQHFRWDHPLIVFATKAVNNRHNAALYFALVARAPSKAFHKLLMLFVPRVRIDWLRTIVTGMNGVVSAEKLKEWLGLPNVEAVAELFAPVAGSAWTPSGGLVIERCRDRLLKYIAEVTEQRSLS